MSMHWACGFARRESDSESEVIKIDLVYVRGPKLFLRYLQL